MSRAGELALKRVIIEYNQMSGVGAGMRQALAREVPAFKRKYPSVIIDVRPRDEGSQTIAGLYKDGSDLVFHSAGFSAQGIFVRLHRLVYTANDHNDVFGPRHVYKARASVQGHWSPWMWRAERHVPRREPAAWDRTLSEAEWDFYVQEYGDEMLGFEGKVQAALDQNRTLPAKHTKEVTEQWKQHVAPTLQSDMEANLQHWKKQAAREKYPPKVTFGEYNLFAMPDTTELGRSTLSALRAKEIVKEAKWWRHRKESLKPPK